MSGHNDSEAATQHTPLISSQKSFVKFKDVRSNIEADLEHAANDFYDAMADDSVVDEDEMDEDAIWLREQRTLNKSLHWLKRPSLFMIGMIAFLFSFSVITGESSRQVILFKLACNTLVLESGGQMCDPVETEVMVSHLKAATLVFTSIVSSLAVTKVGELSDQYGRRVFIISIIVSVFVSRCLKFYLLHNFAVLKTTWIVVAECLACVTGGLMGFMSLLNCYVFDITEVHERSYFIGVAMAFFFTGISLSPMVANVLMSITKKWRLTKVAHRALDSIEPFEWDPLKFELLCIIVLLVFSLTVFPESRNKNARRKSRSLSVTRSDLERSLRNARQVESKVSFYSKKMAQFLNFFRPLRLLWIPEEFKPPQYSIETFFRERLAVFILIMCDCMLTAFSACMGEICMLYGLLVFKWNASSIGYVLAISCGSRAMVLVIIAPLLNRYVYHKGLGFRVMKKQLDMIDFTNVVFAIGTESLMMLIIPFVSSGWFFVLLAVSSFSSLASPSLNSSIVKYYPESKTGEVFSAISLVKNIINLIFPIIFLSLYNVSISKWHYNGFSFHLTSAILAFFVACMFVVKHLLSLHSGSKPEVITRSNSFANSRKSSFASVEEYLASREAATSGTTTPGAVGAAESPARSDFVDGDKKAKVQQHRKNDSFSHRSQT